MRDLIPPFLVFAVNCYIYKQYANYVSEFCLFADISFLKLKHVPLSNWYISFLGKLPMNLLVHESQLNSIEKFTA